ncbi:MAG: hypothetical protein RLZZ58_347 [Pseudomonadota bacterium]
MALGSLIGIVIGIFLIIHALRLVWKALLHDPAAIIQHGRGLEVRTLWRTRSVSFDDYRSVSAETIFVHFAGLPVPGPALMIIHSDSGGMMGKSKLRLPIGHLKLSERAVPMIGEAIELYAMPHREAGAVWHKVQDERAAAERRPPPPAARAPSAPGPAVGGRDTLEGAPCRDLMQPGKGFGRKSR